MAASENKTWLFGTNNQEVQNEICCTNIWENPNDLKNDESRAFQTTVYWDWKIETVLYLNKNVE